jgi:EAL domain-containing protein (putative c-di-GMP-specific phosphodiesterase class I)
MADAIPIAIPAGVVDALKGIVREAVAEELAEYLGTRDSCFLDVNAAAAFLASTPTAIRSLVKRNAIPHYKTPAGRLLFDRKELRDWVKSGSR